MARKEYVEGLFSRQISPEHESLISLSSLSWEDTCNFEKEVGHFIPHIIGLEGYNVHYTPKKINLRLNCFVYFNKSSYRFSF